MKYNLPNFKYISFFISMILVIILLILSYKLLFCKSDKYLLDNQEVYNLHVYPWGTQIMIKDLMAPIYIGDVKNNKFVWKRKLQKYSGFYQLDTGSHLLTDLLIMSRNDLKKNLDENNINYDDLNSSGYVYLQGGTPPINIYQDIRIDNKPHKMPVGLMAIDKQDNMLKEREIVNGVFGLAHIHNGHPLKKYGVTDVLFKTVSKRSIMIDFKNEKMIVGAPIPTDYTFKGLMHYDNNIMRMNVFILDKEGNKNKLLVDTGTLYSQYLSTGPQILEGVKEKGSEGILKMRNAKILPKDLVGVGKKILGYNDLYHGYMYIDYDNNIIYINQNQ
uniref:Aspartyl protease n=1 Tax=viral metagenome TaxID=1070528 RepID=A0A6C0FDJ4_9ZZZZ|tara:strand:- start:1424 stop:2416 length:993 start_codon:yes stop_codon:yes gene_type:complete